MNRVFSDGDDYHSNPISEVVYEKVEGRLKSLYTGIDARRKGIPRIKRRTTGLLLSGVVAIGAGVFVGEVPDEAISIGTGLAVAGGVTRKMARNREARLNNFAHEVATIQVIAAGVTGHESAPWAIDELTSIDTQPGRVSLFTALSIAIHETPPHQLS